jgi:tetratricopeptide (TPR) repeat protein
MNSSPILILCASLAALSACRTAQQEEPYRHVNDLIRRERYEEAVRYSADLAQRSPDDERLDELHRGASVAWHLEQGRRLTFADRDAEALAAFEAAETLNPDSEVVASWVEKTRRKLADRWLNHGLELHANDNLQGAFDAYEKALQYVPGDQSAVSGMAQAVLVMNHRDELAETYYNDGMHALSDYWLEQARARFTYAKKYEENDRTERRIEHVDELLATERVVVGNTFEEDGIYGAARNEYRLALAADPKNEEARAGFERMAVEAKATAKLDEAQMMVLRGEFERAEELLTEGQALSDRQSERFEAARIDIAEERLGRAYQTALNLEKDFLFPQAIEAYQAILDDVQYYRDVLTRQGTLEEYVQRARELYAESRAVQGAERLELLRQIEIFWPDYQGIGEEIERLSRRP